MKQLLIIIFLIPLLSKSQSSTSIDEKIKGMKAYRGFINFYWDDKTGKIFLEIDKLDSAILYQTSMPAALGSNDIGLDRGRLGTTAIIKFSRVGNKVMMTQPNYKFRANTNDVAEKRAVDQSFAQSVLWGFVIEAESNQRVLVDATNFLLRDVMQVINRLQKSRQGVFSIDPTRSAMYLPGTKNFPLNTEFEATVTFATKEISTGGFVTEVSPSSEAFTVRMHHSFVQLPDGNYTPRKFDVRSGFNQSSYFDYSTPVAEPINKIFITRHRLEKKDPSAAMSDPVKPIIYYLDNGTPEPIRSALMEGAAWWNQAFEAAGYKNAFQVRLLPEDADPMDLRYNMINWVHRSTRGWSYGYSVVDPRTGEIIKGNVTLGSLRVRQDYMIAQGLLSPYKNGIPAQDEMLKMSLQRLRQLSAHEVGHTLGLQHNYIASTQGRASVMDYPAPHVKLNAKGDIDLSEAYTNEIGDWDKVTITYGYQDFPPNTDESSALNKIIDDAFKKGLTFISDRDAIEMGTLHPTTHLWDNGKDPVASLKEVNQVRAKALSDFGENSIPKGTPMALLEDVLVPIYLIHRYQVASVAKIIGGMMYSYAVKGDGQIRTSSVSRQQQLIALSSIIDCLDPKFLALPERITKLIPPRPSGYEYTKELFSRRTGLALDPLTIAESAADYPLSFLFTPERLNRMIQYEASYNGLGVDEMINILINKTWKAPRITGLEGLILQQNEQLLLTWIMRAYVSDESSFATRAALLNAIMQIKDIVSNKLPAADKTSRGYFMLTLERINERDKVKPFVAEVMPPGAPIGCPD